MKYTRIVDTRIVYGFRCVWWDGIEQVGKMKGGDGPLGSLPCCPHCGSPLMQMDSPAQWWDGVAKHEVNGHPGYRAFIEWLKGKCYPTIQAAAEAYNAKPGRSVRL